MSKERKFPPQIENYHGVLRIAGTRVPLDLVIEAYERGESPEEICLQYPTVTIANAYSAIAYYLNNHAAVSQYLKRRSAKAETLRRKHEAKWPSKELRRKLTDRIKAPDQHRA